jgi:hypothetical protein
MSTDLIAAVLKLTNAVEQLTQLLGRPEEMRYTRSQQPDDHADERTMSTMLEISSRSLADHRRKGKLPGCSVPIENSQHSRQEQLAAYAIELDFRWVSFVSKRC